MRIAIVALGLVALLSTGLAAQSPAQRHTFVPAHKSRLSIDFGTKQALKRLPQRPADCIRDTKHRHELVPTAMIVELPFYGAHKLTTLPVAPCLVR